MKTKDLCFLLMQNNKQRKWNTVEKLFGLHIVEGIHPLKRAIVETILFWNWKQYTAIIKWLSYQWLSSSLSHRSNYTLTSCFSIWVFCRSFQNLTVLMVINYLSRMKKRRAHVSQFFPFCWYLNSFGCHIVSEIICINLVIANSSYSPLGNPFSFSSFRLIWH